MQLRPVRFSRRSKRHGYGKGADRAHENGSRFSGSCFRSYFVLLLQQMQGVQQHYGRQQRCGRGKERHDIVRSSRYRRPAVHSRKALQNHGTDRGQTRQTEFIPRERPLRRTSRQSLLRMELDEQNRRRPSANSATAT